MIQDEMEGVTGRTIGKGQKEQGVVWDEPGRGDESGWGKEGAQVEKRKETFGSHLGSTLKGLRCGKRWNG